LVTSAQRWKDSRKGSAHRWQLGDQLGSVGNAVVAAGAHAAAVAEAERAAGSLKAKGGAVGRSPRDEEEARALVLFGEAARCSSAAVREEKLREIASLPFASAAQGKALRGGAMRDQLPSPQAMVPQAVLPQRMVPQARPLSFGGPVIGPPMSRSADSC